MQSHFAFVGSLYLHSREKYESFDGAQGALGFLGCKFTLLGHVQPFTLQYPEVLLRAAPYPFIHQRIPSPFVHTRGNSFSVVTMIKTPGSLIFRWACQGTPWPVVASSERQKHLFVTFAPWMCSPSVCERATEAGVAIPSPPTQSICGVLLVHILISACCRRLTRPCSVPGDFLHTCRAGVCALGSLSRLKVSGAWHNVTFLVSQLIAHPQLGPDRLFLSLFCINLRHCSTSSDVTNTHGFSLLSPLRKVGGELVWAVQYFCFGLVILETNLKTYVHFSSFMWQRQGRRDMPGKCSWNLPKSWAVFRDHVTRSLLQAGI